MTTKNKGKIVLMVDAPELHERVAHALTGLGYRLASPVGDDAIQAVFDEVPHLVIVDESFRGGDGRKIALHLKEDVILKSIPVILLIDSSENLFRASDEPINFYFQKDRSLQELLARVREATIRYSHELDLNPLTHLPGMRTSILRMEKALRSKKSISVCYVDLADMAAFNSAYGDSRGDQVIIRAGRILHQAVKTFGGREDFLGHLGGGDFLVLTGSHRAATIAEAAIRGFDAVIGQFYDAADREKARRMTILVSLVADPNRAAGKIADVGRIGSELKKAMEDRHDSCYVSYPYPAIKEGGAKDISLEVRFPTKKKSITLPWMGLGSDKFMAFSQGILRDKKIRTVFQPMVDLKSCRVIGYEALTRGTAPGLVDESTLLFNLAAESGRAIELDKLCVDTALQSAQALDPEMRLFLNLNPETLVDPKAMKGLLVRKGNLGLKNLVIEITERSILRSFEKVKDALHALRQEGVSVAIDDVGGGAVSLRDVAILKPDYIKFDRSLIREIDTNVTKQQIVLSLILFANGIQALTTAEGIETKEELSAVSMCGVNLGQGYFFAKPDKAFPVISSPVE